MIMKRSINELFHLLKQEIINQKTSLLSIGNILLEMWHLEKTEVYYQQYLKSLSVNNMKDYQ